MKITSSTRIVLIFKNFVIKIPVSYRGYLQCKNEKFIWYKYKHKKFNIGNLYWYKYGIVCMEKYELSDTLPLDNIIKIKEQISELNIENCDLHVLKNWGVKLDEYYLIDYGINEKISKMY